MNKYTIISLLAIKVFNAIGILWSNSVESKITYFGIGVILILFYIALAVIGKGDK